ncbi:phage tail terminator-like protein [Gibbsiella quercinecans]|uniref:phage tail terminator-like protein n=1 Tax=Gibbsiella quercinecans TaxID=929813 RepID=UPI0024305213|nr:phage tail terminator-like protein [Gibbsiella quercinecans]
MHYDLELAARDFVYSNFPDVPMCIPNVNFNPPSDGSNWIKFDYIEALTETVSLDRQCRVFIGIVQVGVVFSPGAGTDAAKNLAKAIAKSARDGIMLATGYIVEAGAVKPTQPSGTGWMIPVRFAVRTETKEEE